MSSAIRFNLDQSKILSSDNGLNLEIFVCKLLQFGRVKNLLFGKKLKDLKIR